MRKEHKEKETNKESIRYEYTKIVNEKGNKKGTK
jgi:hypothetical protein